MTALRVDLDLYRAAMQTPNVHLFVQTLTMWKKIYNTMVLRNHLTFSAFENLVQQIVE